MKLNFRTASVMAILSGVTLITACGKSDQAEQQAAAEQQMPPAVVDVQTISLGAVPIIQEASGRVVAVETSEVRPQVTGIIDQVLFREGSYVRAGDPLYRINIDNYKSSIESGRAAVANAEAAAQNARAAHAQAQANLTAQRATLAQARADLARLQGLVEADAIAQQTYDQAVTAVRTAEANAKAAEATVAQAVSSIKSADASIGSAKASLSASELDLSRTIVRAPISGKIGISAVTSGALVSASQANALATISRTDLVYVDISQSSSEMLRLRQQLESGAASQGSPEVRIVLEDGTIYPMLGRLALSNSKVDEATGAVTVRAIFQNPNDVLLPGMYVNAQMALSVVHNAALLPQSAVTRTPKGDTQVYVVNAENKVEVRNVTINGTYDGKWVVTDGLNNGDVVVVIGGAKVEPEQEVQTRELPATTEQNPAANGAQANSAQTEQAPASQEPQAQADASSEAGKNSVMKADESSQNAAN
ncbi:efflux transporter periplasmic adaptor subunit [Moraxella caviae]|uniref:Acriflavine resistance protein A n=1 Tax=Moraxella caviae TaxID=34060 RepID=A0A1T0A910_9GAMM|nr:efflux RND transporter periplasmic adaptor subunit [Moraxella caviae]OOR92222.1 efflux transporter periplasmic adaptor subunit [Moraxella caviae]STZ14858.1 Acriflavine resistance protein A precursor [Moraxella caviae]